MSTNLSSLTRQEIEMAEFLAERWVNAAHEQSAATAQAIMKDIAETNSRMPCTTVRHAASLLRARLAR